MRPPKGTAYEEPHHSVSLESFTCPLSPRARITTCTWTISHVLQAPALEAIEFYETDFDNQFAHRSEYRGPPTVERESAWLDLWHRKPAYFFFIHVTYAPLSTDSSPTDEGIKIESWQMTMLNRTNLDMYEKVKPEQGDGYVALLEVHHQLHCLVSRSLSFLRCRR